MNNQQDSIWHIRDSEHTLAQEAEEDYWVDEHSNGFNVFTLVADDEIIAGLIGRIKNMWLPSASRQGKVLISGCGIQNKFEIALAQAFPQFEFHCGDFPEVVKLARANFEAYLKEQGLKLSNICYRPIDATNLAEQDEYDLIITINSVVATNHSTNTAMIKNFYQALKPQGILMGIYPSIWALADMLSVHGKSDFETEGIDLARNSYFEKHQQVEQIFYSPLRLRQMMLSAGFKIDRFEIFFCDTPDIATASREYYPELCDPDVGIVLYEHYVEATKPNKTDL